MSPRSLLNNKGTHMHTAEATIDVGLHEVISIKDRAPRMLDEYLKEYDMLSMKEKLSNEELERLRFVRRISRAILSLIGASNG